MMIISMKATTALTVSPQTLHSRTKQPLRANTLTLLILIQKFGISAQLRRPVCSHAKVLMKIKRKESRMKNKQLPKSNLIHIPFNSLYKDKFLEVINNKIKRYPSLLCLNSLNKVRFLYSKPNLTCRGSHLTLIPQT
jgi:hypothetical protein